MSFPLRLSIAGLAGYLFDKIFSRYSGQPCIKYEQSGTNDLTLSIEYQPPGKTAYFWDIYNRKRFLAAFLTYKHVQEFPKSGLPESLEE